MKYLFQAQNLTYATTMINEWKYPEEYHIYNYENEKEDLLNHNLWGQNRFVALNKKCELAGELTIEFFDETLDTEDTYVEARTVRATPNKDYEMWIGFGLRPDLVGKGLGEDFIKDCIEYAVSTYDYKGQYVRLAVAEFNQRAIKIYKRLGFEQFDTYEGNNTKILWFRKDLTT